MSGQARSNFKRDQALRNLEEGKVCKNHCDCCDTKTTQETYRVTIKECLDGGRVNVGDNVKVYATENVFINPKERTIIQLEPEASLRLVDELIKRLDENSDSRPIINERYHQSLEELDVLKLMKSHSYVERTRKDNELKSPVEVPPQNKETNEEVLPKNINTNRSEIENVIETDGERNRERQEIESNVTRSKDSSGNDVITFEVFRTIQSKVPKVRRRKINGVLLSLCAAFCTLPVAVVVIWFISYQAGMITHF